MSEAGRDYVVYGMRARCSEGTMDNYISTDTGHGVVYQGCPLLNANDHTAQVNLTHFGDCNSKKIYEDAKKQADEKYAAEEGEGFFSKAAKWVAKTATKALISAKEHFFFHKCELDTPLPWIFVNEEHMIDGAPALTVDSQCACRYGGIITIVPPETETAELEITEGEGTMEPAMAGNVVAAAPVLLSEKSDETDDERLKKIQRVGWMGANLLEYARFEALDNSLKELEEYQYIDKYVTEKILGDINPQWTANMDTFKHIYGENVLTQMRVMMWQYNITDEASILMFLSTMGEETGYGTSVIQGTAPDDKYVDLENLDERVDSLIDNNPPQIDAGRGIGLVQVTDISQSNFIRWKYNSLPDGDSMKEIMYNYFGKDAMEGSDRLDNSEGFLYTYYPIEASMWYWGALKEKVAIFDDSVPLGRTNYTINDYIAYYNENSANMDNVFLAVQYALNGRKGLSRKNLQTICEKSDYVLGGNQTTISVGNNTASGLPNGWSDRKTDWDKAKGFMQDEGE